MRGGRTPGVAESVHKKPHRGIEPRCGSLTLLVAYVVCVAYVVTAAGAAFSVFCWLKVMNFDRFFVFLLFLCFVLHITITFQLFVVCVVSVSVTPNST